MFNTLNPVWIDTEGKQVSESKSKDLLGNTNERYQDQASYIEAKVKAFEPIALELNKTKRARVFAINLDTNTYSYTKGLPENPHEAPVGVSTMVKHSYNQGEIVLVLAEGVGPELVWYVVGIDKPSNGFG